MISVLLPAYDAEATLDACLRSILRQRETGWECIVVDDGSRDGTAMVPAPSTIPAYASSRRRIAASWRR